MPSAALAGGCSTPTAVPNVKSGLNTELLNAWAGASPILLLLICNSVFLTPAPMLVSFSRRATLPLSALHDAKERDGLRALRQASISWFRHIHSPFRECGISNCMFLETLRLIFRKTFPYVGHSVSPKRHFGSMFIRQFQHNAIIYWKAYSLVME